MLNADPPVWQLVTDLPLSAVHDLRCGSFTKTRWSARGARSIPIVDDGDPSAPNKVNIVLECSLSVIPPSGDLDVDGSFEFIHGNYCPKLNWLGAVIRRSCRPSRP